jgi:ABC-type dipeptide/oligopeptide/nickel transport system ATPase subunit
MSLGRLLIALDVEIVETVADHFIVLRRGETVFDSPAAEFGTCNLVDRFRVLWSGALAS